MNEPRQLLTIKQAANMLGVTTLTLRNWDKAGKLSALRHPINNYRVYKRQDIERLLGEIASNTKPVNSGPKKKTRRLDVHHL